MHVQRVAKVVAGLVLILTRIFLVPFNVKATLISSGFELGVTEV